MTVPPDYLRQLLDTVADQMGEQGATFAGHARSLRALTTDVVEPKMCVVTLVWDERFPEFILMSGRVPDETAQLRQTFLKAGEQIDDTVLENATRKTWNEAAGDYFTSNPKKSDC